MKIAIHDFSGHPFQAQLSRVLAEAGHHVVHTYSAQYVGGKGNFTDEEFTRGRVEFGSVTVPTKFAKYSFSGRLAFELQYGLALAKSLNNHMPDVALLCNIPPLAMAICTRNLTKHSIPWLFWHQDIYSEGISKELHARLPRTLATTLSRAFERIERSLVLRAAGVIAIDKCFEQKYVNWRIPPGRSITIPNWAPIDEIVPCHRDNHWSTLNLGSENRLRLLYSGTLGRKHNPLLLLKLLDNIQNRGVAAELVVISQGDGVEDLRQAASDRFDVRIFPFQPAHSFSEVLSSADVLIALLEPAASNYSVPSKVMSYCAAGRPVAGLMPGTNAASALIRSAGGAVEEPAESGVDALAGWIALLAEDQHQRHDVGQRFRQYAEETFNIENIRQQFEKILSAAVAVRGSNPSDPSSLGLWHLSKVSGSRRR